MNGEQNDIPVSKLARAGALVNVGAKVGKNYLKHYAKKLINDDSPDQLDEDNAKDIYEAFTTLKGGPLKIAQVLSMGQELLPKAYVDQFAMAQSQVPPLSYPLIRRTFYKSFGKYPEDIFDTFSKQASNAASIGQVHKATLDGKTLAIKIQYPGVADSLKSDLKMVKMVALKMLQLPEKDMKPYIAEVENKLFEEIDYTKELKHSCVLSEGCKHLENVVFPKYYPDLSNKKILTMSWIDGLSFNDWLGTSPSQQQRNNIGQQLWDLYQYQINVLNNVQADPHPGNFIITPDERLGVIDFGCTKHLPNDFYPSYAKLLDPELLKDRQRMINVLHEIELLRNTDSPREQKIVADLFYDMFSLVSAPIHSQTFDFSDADYFKKIYTLGERFSRDKEIKKLSARGSRHFIYLNRTQFGLYQLLHLLEAEIVANLDTYIVKK